MSTLRPAVVVSLPGRSLGEVRTEILRARAAGADLAEVRVDRLPPEERGRVGALFPSSLPLLATFRSTVEGGEGPADPTERSAILVALGSLPFRWVDLELERDLPAAGRLPPPKKVGRIVSLHLPAASSDRWEEAIARLDAVDGVGKLVVPATIAELVDRLLPLVERRPLGQLVVHTTGPSGPILRALARRLGFPFVYAALPDEAGREPVEPTQIPVDRLRPFLDNERAEPWFAVAGHPIGHSRSPAIHARWLKADRRRSLYVPLDFADEPEFVDHLRPLAERGLKGMNVTHPFKRAAFGAAEELGSGAVACGAVNCLRFEDDGLFGENTDLVAIARRLHELRESGAWAGDELAIVGAGGSARATAAAARVLGLRPTIYARDPKAGRALAVEFSSDFGSELTARPTGLVVHATNVGRAGSGVLDAPFGQLLGPRSYVLDWVYAPVEPTVAQIARAQGAAYEDGYRLLVYQAAASYACWWGSEPSSSELRAALEVGS